MMHRACSPLLTLVVHSRVELHEHGLALDRLQKLGRRLADAGGQRRSGISHRACACAALASSLQLWAWTAIADQLRVNRLGCSVDG